MRKLSRRLLIKGRIIFGIIVLLTIVAGLSFLEVDKNGSETMGHSFFHQVSSSVNKADTIEQKYVDLTVSRLNLKPLDQQLIPSDYPYHLLGAVVNDIVSLQYSLEVSNKLMEKTCFKWNKDSLKNDTLLVVVISAVAHFEQRRMIRDTWASNEGELISNYNVQVVFLVGLSPDKKEIQQLANESAIYEDVIQVNAVDSYSNLTLKTVALLYWTYTRCPKVNWILKCDDDNYVNGQFLVTLLNEISPSMKNSASIYGKVVPTLIPERKKSKICLT